MELKGDLEPSSSGGDWDLQSTPGLLALMRVREVGAKKALALALTVGSTERLESLSPDDLKQIVGVRAARSLVETPPRLADPPDINDAWTLSYFDEAYPPRFRRLADPPPVLWGRGALPDSRAVAVVGTRHPSAWASDTAVAVCTSAVEEGFAVVSGLAIGVDTVAHEATLAASGITTAILGSGVDTIYPASNKKLAQRVLEAGGTILAEVAPGTRVNGGALVARDRLQAALGLGTVIVQSGVPGGTLHTARYTLELDHPLVVALPRTEGRLDPDGPYAGNVALADSNGCDPAILKASGPLALHLAKRKPLADLVVSSRRDLHGVWEVLESFETSAEGKGLGWRQALDTERSRLTSMEPSPTLPL